MTSEAATLTLDEPPTISCPSDVENGKVGQPVNLGTPITNDDMGQPPVANDAPEPYLVGVTTVTWATTDTAVSPGGLKYDATSGQYVYTWKTTKGSAGTCRQLVIKLVDGTEHTASFKFR